MFSRRAILILLAALFSFRLAAEEEATVDFNRDIRPILNDHCLKCHGGVKEAGDLNLQFREQALRAGETGEIAIVPGNPEESAFVDRITTDDSTDRMPKKAEPLSPKQIAVIRQWIAEGAPWGKHWSYETPRRCGKSIDEIVRARLAKEGLALSPDADVRILARRLAFDLTGLPPEPARVDALEKAAAADREEALRGYVDELLASPAYGERWAVPWLDLARYADSKGYESDRFRDMWRYRDWVVDALNTDMPYDEFVTEQLAGDLLPNPTAEQIIATAYHRNTPQNDEGGTDNEEFRTYAVLDRVNATFDAIQGTSIGCVQCHGHPYDPFRHEEYYQLVAFFNNTADADRDDQAPTRKFRAPADAREAAKLEAEIAAAQAKLDAEVKEPTLRAAYEKWLAEMRGPEALAPLTELKVAATAGEFMVQTDGRLLVKMPPPERATLTVTGNLDAALREIGAIALEMIPDDSLPKIGPGANEGVGNFILTHLSAAIVKDGAETPVEIAKAKATFEQDGWPVAEALRHGPGPRNEGEGGWAIAGGTGKAQTATFFFPKPVTVPAGALLQVKLECENERWPRHVLGSFRIATSEGSQPNQITELPKEIADLLGKDPVNWKPEERAKVERQFFANASREIAEQYQTLDDRRKDLAALPVCDLPIMQELTGQAARKTQVFHRGNWMDKTDEVQPATPQILNPWHDDYSRNRLGLAKWLTNGENPLTARVQVNRVWEQLFGIGLVETLEDFGSQGDFPIYQDLLDDLAARFQTDMQWSQKTLLREIVLSRTYRQSSKATPADIERDPANRLLARGPRFRLSNEQLRDQALAVSGLLSRKMGGPPVMPFQPPGTWLVPYEGRDWENAKGADAHR
ncbi:MAG: PSD1 and planctomycete cytochrome C domain-containing protein, partial [Chthoniobacteraceae bacterium]